MLLKNKVAAVYGAGAIGGAVPAASRVRGSESSSRTERRRRLRHLLPTSWRLEARRTPRNSMP
jgi:hypothetical protein